MAAVLHLVTGTAEVLASLRRSLSDPESAAAGAVVTAPLPPGGPERAQTCAMLRPELPVIEPDAAAIVATSGSTGHPRGVVLSRAALLASARATAARLGGHGSWVLALPAHYVAGLMVLVRAIAGDRPVHPVDGRLAELPSLVEHELSTTEGPYYTALVPTQLSRALADPALTRALTRFDTVLLGGATADPSLLERASAAGIRLVTTYGMSETCGGCVYDGVPLDGASVSTDERGRISIGGPMLFSGYRLDPTATADALVDRRLRTRDRGRFTGNRLEVLGRLDDIVISGGLNIDLAAVERALLTWISEIGTLDTEAAVVGLPHPEWGTEVVAVVDIAQNHPFVPSPPRDSDSVVETQGRFSLSALRQGLSAELPHYALPRRLLLRPLPRTSGGKIDRRRLVADLSHLADDDLAADRAASEPAESR
ncbi:MAG: AMP-binding protein [Microlunatus sp.]